jgi:hypothetical protein
VKRLIALVPLVAVLIALVLLGVADTPASIADTSVPESVSTSTSGQADDSNYLASATLKMIMHTPPLPEE